MNTSPIHEYFKIVWIKENTCQNLYNPLNTTRHAKKYEYDTDTRIAKSNIE